MKALTEEVLAGSVVVTSDATIWYSCGDWQLKGVKDAIPCIPAYLIEERFPKGHPVQKEIQVGGVRYIKVFGHYGLPLEVHRSTIYPSMQNMIYSRSYGRMVFVKKNYIKHLSSPTEYRAKMFRELPEAREVFEDLAEVLGIPIESLGISGSVVAVKAPSWRHETDFTVHGYHACETAVQNIHQNRLVGVFSQEQLAPYHMPFKYKGKWFDPHYSDPQKERRLQGAEISRIATLKEKVFLITEASEGIYYPAIYSVQEGKRLITFRTSQRGLYRKGQRVSFEKISLAQIVFPGGVSEEFYMVSDDEWGEIL